MADASTGAGSTDGGRGTGTGFSSSSRCMAAFLSVHICSSSAALTTPWRTSAWP
jgi:hypothetical protein